jgi:hypothetical protein
LIAVWVAVWVAVWASTLGASTVGASTFGTRFLSLAGALAGLFAAAAGTVWDALWSVAAADFPGGLVAAGSGSLFNLVGLFGVFEFEEVGYIKEGVALKANVHKGGLHPGEDASDAAVID